VDFVEQINKSLIDVRTYERGVEGETKACGTGSVASAIIAFFKSNPGDENKEKAKIKVKTTSGEFLEITFDVKNKKAINVWLKGKINFIADGIYYY